MPIPWLKGCTLLLALPLCFVSCSTAGDSLSIDLQRAYGKRVALAKNARSNRVKDQQYKDGDVLLVDMSGHNAVLEVREREAIVQPSCTMESLVKATLPKGLIPKVVCEFKKITAAGAVSGAGLESSSHRCGQFNDVCTYFNVMLGNGTAVRVDKGAHELFDAIPGAYGSLGLLTEIGVELEPATSHIKLKVKWYSDLDQGLGALVAACGGPKPPAFIEALQLPSKAGQEGLALITGDWCDEEAHAASQRKWRERSYGLWYYEMIQSMSREEGAELGLEVTIPTTDYLFRHDACAYWMGRPMTPPQWSWQGLRSLTPSTAMLLLVTSRNIICRLLFRWLYSADRLYRMLHLASPKAVAEKMVVLDAYIPPEHISSVVGHLRSFPISTPLWLCPVRAPSKPQLLSPHGHVSPGHILVNVGCYGRVSDGEGERYMREAESWVAQVGGRKMLYSQNWYTKEDFWRLYDREGRYQGLRYRYAAEAFPDLYAKVCHQGWDESDTQGWHYRVCQAML
ncbi:unnamed protein product [Chrysoparadoxa australica]